MKFQRSPVSRTRCAAAFIESEPRLGLQHMDNGTIVRQQSGPMHSRGTYQNVKLQREDPLPAAALITDN